MNKFLTDFKANWWKYILVYIFFPPLLILCINWFIQLLSITPNWLIIICLIVIGIIVFSLTIDKGLFLSSFFSSFLSWLFFINLKEETIPQVIQGASEITRKKKQRNPDPKKHQDALLLKGIVAVAGLLIFIAILAIIPWREFPGFILKNNFLISFFVVIIVMQFAFWKKSRKNLCWKSVKDIWLKAIGVSGLSIGGFSLIVLSPSITEKILNITIKSPYVKINNLVTFYICSVILLGLGGLFFTVGHSYEKDEKAQKPLVWFAVTFGLVWLGCLGYYTIFFNSVFMILHAHLQ